MDAWRNAKDIQEIKDDIEKIKQHLVTITELVLKGKVTKPEEPKPQKVETSKEEPKKRSWFGNKPVASGDKN